MDTQVKRILISALLLASWAGNASAQEQKFEHVRTYTVKRDRMADWESAVKELNAIYKKANVVAPTLVYQSLTGPEHFLIVRHYETISKAMANRSEAFKGEFARPTPHRPLIFG